LTRDRFAELVFRTLIPQVRTENLVFLKNGKF
jgi:hypothetical protein